MIPANELPLQVGQPKLGAINPAPVVTNTACQTTTANVAGASFPRDIPPVRGGLVAAPKVVPFPYGSMPFQNPPPSSRGNIRTLSDLPPVEDRDVTEVRETVREVTGSLEKFADMIKADVNQLGAEVEGVRDVNERLDRAAATIEALTIKIQEGTQRSLKQTEQLELLCRLVAERDAGIQELTIKAEEEENKISVRQADQANFLERNWRVIEVFALSVINLVAINVIFGIGVTVLLSTALMIGAAFWEKYLNRISSEKPTVF